MPGAGAAVVVAVAGGQDVAQFGAVFEPVEEGQDGGRIQVAVDVVEVRRRPRKSAGCRREP
ncbi:hypothetical protein [Streptomyces sp. NBC_00045]|uniref:hypothetical protein n=1 Tax=Streptomyces sp. NBC_00045 TaxID=2975625 RepID=UPI003253A417